MKHLFAALLLALTLSSCSPANNARIGAGDLADAGTTFIGLSNGFTEANPLFALCGPAAPVCGIGGKVLMKGLLIELGMTHLDANLIIEEFGAGAACLNVVTLAAGSLHPAGFIVGIICAVVYDKQFRKLHPETTLWEKSSKGIPTVKDGEMIFIFKRTY